ncbi:MAG: hypothetical protein KDC80_15180 [Saprospiraceae bacterium]|nr:hypothetical protein [Saprospiraceae bacterium]
MQLLNNSRGNYRFLKGISPYSAGVIADPGYEIIHATLQRPVPIFNDAISLISQYLKDFGRPVQAICAMELRIPEPLSFDGFKSFNVQYRSLLADADLLLDDINPVARTNISQQKFPFDSAMIYAFSYTMPRSDPGLPASFVVSGAGDIKDQADLSPGSIVRPDDTSEEALKEKASVVLEEMQRRLHHLQTSWDAVTSIDIYSVRNILPLLQDNTFGMIGQNIRQGLHWYYSLPPISGLEFEMDVRGVNKDIMVAF